MVTTMEGEAVITGVGALTPAGTSSVDTWNAIRRADSGIAELSRFDPEAANLRSTIAGEVDLDAAALDERGAFGDFDAFEGFDERNAGRYAKLALLASAEAIADADLTPGDGKWAPERVGVSIASGMGGFPEIEAAVEGSRVGPRFPITHLSNLAAGYVSQQFAAEGPNRAPATACAAGTHAIGEALRDIRAGRAEVVIAGGTDAPLSPTAVRGFDSMRALSTAADDPTRASRPFDADRDGFVMAEGAGILVLESPDHAAQRDVEPLATLTGFARTADAHHPTRPPEDASGLSRCLRTALRDAGREPDAVDHVNAHATGTPEGDAHEATAVKRVFDDVPPVTSVKSVLGHTMGACGAIEAVVAAKSVRDGVRPPTMNHESPDPACDVPVVEATQAADVDVVASNSAGFGGTNGTIIIERYEH